MADEYDLTYEGHMSENSVPVDGVKLSTMDYANQSVERDEYLSYLRAFKRIHFGEPIPESTFTDVQNPVLRRRLVRAICLRKASVVQEPTT